MENDIIKCIQNKDNNLLDKLIPKINYYRFVHLFNNLNKNEYNDLFYVIYLINKGNKDNFLFNNKLRNQCENIIDKLIDLNNNYISGWSVYIYLINWKCGILNLSNDIIKKIKNIKGEYLFKKIIYKRFVEVDIDLKYDRFLFKKYNIKHIKYNYYLYLNNKYFFYGNYYFDNKMFNKSKYIIKYTIKNNFQDLIISDKFSKHLKHCWHLNDLKKYAMIVNLKFIKISDSYLNIKYFDIIIYLILKK